LTSVQCTGQNSPEQLRRLLERPIQATEVAAFQMQQYLMVRVPQLPEVPTAESWRTESNSIRNRVLETIFHGWPQEWVKSPPRFEDLGTISAGPGYRIRKLRYEIVPGFQTTAVLYEPEHLARKTPAILDVSGHDYREGKAAAFEQRRCINQAKQGFIALKLEWIGCGELRNPENMHWFAGQLDLVGANGVGLFYLAARKGLDYLYQNPTVDHSRIGMTGVSGGGWQTILLSSIDERVGVAVPVAGYSALQTSLEHPKGIGQDLEQFPTDLFVGQEYTHFTAMLAPRPALLIYNANDNCCWQAPVVKPLVFEATKPFYRLFGKEDQLAWHENRDPGNHNYERDNRIHSYGFFGKYFGLDTIVNDEAPVDDELKSYDELSVGLPEKNLTLVTLAKRMAARRQLMAQSTRRKLDEIVRYRPLSVKRLWTVASTKDQGLESKSYRFDLSDGLSATAVWVKAISSSGRAPIVILLNDQGRKNSLVELSDCVNRGEQVLALDLLFTGDASPGAVFAPVLASLGDRPVGIEAAQLVAIAGWLKRDFDAQQVRVIATGMRSQTISLITAALEPMLFRGISVSAGMRSFRELLDTPVPYAKAPELFCLDLYRYFDVDSLTNLAQPTKVTQLQELH
jgi:hypothetical protein